MNRNLIAALAIFVLIFAALDNTAVAGTNNYRPVVGEDKTHIASTEENLYTIAQQYGLAIEHLAFANDIYPVQLYVEPGKQLNILLRRVLPRNPPANGIVVNLPERGLYLFLNNHYAGFYPIAIGQPGRFQTPCGSYRILSRVKNPTWHSPSWAGLGEETVGPGPLNPLGDRWLGVTPSGVGIHSTNTPVYVGEAVSHSCIRMYPEMIHELYEKVWVGMQVRIEYETTKVGRDSEGHIFVASFPDVYGKARQQ